MTKFMKFSTSRSELEKKDAFPIFAMAFVLIITLFLIFAVNQNIPYTESLGNIMALFLPLYAGLTCISSDVEKLTVTQTISIIAGIGSFGILLFITFFSLPYLPAAGTWGDPMIRFVVEYLGAFLGALLGSGLSGASK